MVIASKRRMPIFAALAAGILTVEWGISHSLAFSKESLLPYAVLADLVVILPMVYYFLVLRPTKRAPLEAAPVAVIGSLIAAVLLTARHEVADLVLWSGILAELAVLVFLGQKLHTAAHQFNAAGRADDPLLRLEAMPERWVRLLGLELIVLYFAFVGPRVRRTRAENEFGYTEKSGVGGLLFALGFVTVVEGLLVHVLLRQWHPVAGWIFTGLHVYTLLWLAAAYQAARLRPVVVFTDTLLFRFSLLWTAEIPRSKIAAVEPIKTMPEDKTILRAVFGDEPQLLLTLTEPVAVRGLFGICKRVLQIALSVDEPEKLQAALR
ncbi:hypothetical protein [Armatimonas sp.]|uniref:hypothetical protein n=1 Tax=Armatimonas sp. TaxID=1872638 RepID=UPI0037511D9C